MACDFDDAAAPLGRARAAAHRRRRGARHLPARHRPAPRPHRPRRDRRRRRPHRRAARSATCPCGEGFTSPLGAEGTMVTGSWRASACRSASRRCSRSRTAGSSPRREPEGERLLAALRRRRRPQGRNVAELGIGTNERADADRQHPRGREDPRHRARRLRGQRGDRRDGLRARAPGLPDPRADARDRLAIACSSGDTWRCEAHRSGSSCSPSPCSRWARPSPTPVPAAAPRASAAEAGEAAAASRAAAARRAAATPAAAAPAAARAAASRS